MLVLQDWVHQRCCVYLIIQIPTYFTLLLKIVEVPVVQTQGTCTHTLEHERTDVVNAVVAEMPISWMCSFLLIMEAHCRGEDPPGVLQERISERIREQVVDAFVPRVVEQVIEVPKIPSRDRILQCAADHSRCSRAGDGESMLVDVREITLRRTEPSNSRMWSS